MSSHDHHHTTDSLTVSLMLYFRGCTVVHGGAFMIDKHRVTKAPANSGSLFYNEGNILSGGTGSCTTCKLGLLLSLQIRVIQDH